MACTGICRHQHGLDSQEQDFIAANKAVLGEFMDRIDRVADKVDRQRMGPSGDADCADTLRTAVQQLRQVHKINSHHRVCNSTPVELRCARLLCSSCRLVADQISQQDLPPALLMWCERTASSGCCLIWLLPDNTVGVCIIWNEKHTMYHQHCGKMVT